MMRTKYLFLGAAAAIWVLVTGGGMAAMCWYSFEAGEAGKSPVVWPAASHLRHSPAFPTLVMVVHPHCPCSRASIGELARLMAPWADRIQAYVIFVQPPGVEPGWARTDLWKSVTLIRGATLVLDDGTEARLFGAATSGQTVVYDANGHLLFSGGITASRGQFGDNLGMRSVIAVLRQSGASHEYITPVYGCPLFSAGSKRKTHPETCHR